MRLESWAGNRNFAEIPEPGNCLLVVAGFSPPLQESAQFDLNPSQFPLFGRLITAISGRPEDLTLAVLQAQSRLSLRAASVEPVDGWQSMQLEHCQSRCVRWIAPAPAISGSDIEKAQPEVRADGYRVIKVVYTDAAVNKMRDLTAAQVKKPIALVVDGKLLWAPQVNFTQTDKESSLTGNTPSGLTQEEVDLIMSILPPAK